MRSTLTDKEVDNLPVVRFRRTEERLRARRKWGRRAGQAAFARGDEKNPFWERPHMPMHDAWELGYVTDQRTAFFENEKSVKATVDA